MEPRKLLKELMQRSGDNSNSLAVKLRGKTTQPQIYKFIEGKVKEPRRGTLQPIADHYGVSVDAFYEEDVAQAEYDRLFTQPNAIDGQKITPPQTLPKSSDDVGSRSKAIDGVIVRLSEAVDGLMDQSLFNHIPDGWDLVREWRSSGADFTLLDENLKPVCGIEVKRFPQSGHRTMQQSRLDTLIGFLWRNAHEESPYRRHLPMAIVALVENAEELDAEVKIASNDLIKTLALAHKSDLLIASAVLGLKRVYVGTGDPHQYELQLYAVEASQALIYGSRQSLGLMMLDISERHRMNKSKGIT